MDFGALSESLETKIQRNFKMKIQIRKFKSGKFKKEFPKSYFTFYLFYL